MICSFHINNLVCVLPARQLSSIIIIPCNIDCFKRQFTSLLLKFTNFHHLSINNNHRNNSNHEKLINSTGKYNRSHYLLTIVYIFMFIAVLSIPYPKVSATSSSASSSSSSLSSSSNPWSQSNRYLPSNNNNQHFLQSSSSSTLINDRNRLKYQQIPSSASIFKYNGPYYRPLPPPASKYNQRISNNTNSVRIRTATSNYGDGNISSPSRILNSGDTIIPTSLSSSFPSFSSVPSSSSVHFPFDEPSNSDNSRVNGYISVASSILPETFYQKTLKRQSSSASSLNGFYSLDERNNSSNSPSSSSNSLSSSLTSSSLSIQPSTPLTLNHIPSPPQLQLSSSSSTTTTTLPDESPFASSSSSSPYLPSSSPTPSSLSATTLGYHLTEDRFTSIDIRDLLRKELDERVMEQQKAKQPHHHHHQQQQSPSTPLPSSSVNLFALLPPKRDDLDRLASNNNKNTGGGSPISTSPVGSTQTSNRINGITNGHSRSPPGINILVFKPNTPMKGSTEGSESPKNWGETFGLPPRIPLKPGGYNDHNPPSSSSTSSSDARNKLINYHRGTSGTNNLNLNHHNNDGFRVYSDKEGENIGINYITRNNDNSGSTRNKPSSSTTTTTTTTTSTSTIQPITKTNVTTLLAVGGSGNNVIKKVPDSIDYSSNDLNNNNINNHHNGNNNNDRSGSNSGHRPNGNNHDRYDYDYDGHGISSDSNGTTTSLTETNGPDDAFVNGEAYRLTTERLAYILIGSCCALSILCLIIVAFSIRCRDMCDEYKAWKKAEKLAMLNYRYQNSHARQRLRSGIPGNGSASGPVGGGGGGGGGRVIGGPEANFFSHRVLGEQDSNLSYPPIKASRPIFGPSCCCCPAPGSTGSAWHGRGTETCPRGYFHPCPRGKLPFGAASSIQAFPRNHVPVAAVTNNFPSDEDDSLNASIVDDGRAGPSGITVANPSAGGGTDPKGVILDSSEGHHGHLNQCTCVEPPAPSGFDSEAAAAAAGQPSNRHHHGHHHIHHSHQHGHSSTQQQQQTSGQQSGQPQSSSSSNHHLHHQHVHHQHHQQQQRKQQLNNGQTNGENDKSFNPSWLQSSIIVDELHRKHSQLVRENAKSPKSRNPEDQRYIFWSENQDRLI